MRLVNLNVFAHPCMYMHGHTQQLYLFDLVEDICICRQILSESMREFSGQVEIGTVSRKITFVTYKMFLSCCCNHFCILCRLWHAQGRTQCWKLLATLKLTNEQNAKVFGKLGLRRSWRNSRNLRQKGNAGRNIKYVDTLDCCFLSCFITYISPLYNRFYLQ